MKEYRLEKKPSSCPTKEQAKLNKETLDEQIKNLKDLVSSGAKWLHDNNAGALLKKVESGEVAYTSIDKSTKPLVFSKNLASVSYNGKSLILKTNNLEGTMIRLLVNAAIDDGEKWVANEIIAEAMNGDFPDYDGGFGGIDGKTVKNARSRLNEKFEKVFGIKTAIESRNPKKLYEGGGGRSRFRVKCEIKK